MIFLPFQQNHFDSVVQKLCRSLWKGKFNILSFSYRFDKLKVASCRWWKVLFCSRCCNVFVVTYSNQLLCQIFLPSTTHLILCQHFCPTLYHFNTLSVHIQNVRFFVARQKSNPHHFSLFNHTPPLFENSTKYVHHSHSNQHTFSILQNFQFVY